MRQNDNGGDGLDTRHDATGVLARLPGSFVIGAGSSAFQIEGATTADGRGASIWDAFLASSERGVAPGCDHYHRPHEDLNLVEGLGVDAYRLSVSWPRILPSGSGRANERGIAFYERIVADLRDRGIAPVVCLYHWELPQALQDEGGWASRDTALRFGEFSALMAERLGAGVELWVTVNEPFVHLLRGHIMGDHAPGVQLEDWSAIAHHLLLAHGQAVSALRGAAVPGAVGMIENFSPVRPATPEPADQGAAFIFDLLRNQLLLGGVLAGAYPPMFLERRPTLAAAVREGDMKAIAAPLDFLGINYYGPTGVCGAPPGELPPFKLTKLDGLPATGLGTMIDPDGLHESLMTLTERYPDTLPPLLVTEIGRDCPDTLDEHGACADPDRIAFATAHLQAIERAIADGADVRGCFFWSFLDSFEWDHGCGPRYGLVHVDFETGASTPKQSYAWLATELSKRGPRAMRGAQLARELHRAPTAA